MSLAMYNHITIGYSAEYVASQSSAILWLPRQPFRSSTPSSFHELTIVTVCYAACLARIQSVLNAAARIMYGGKLSDHVTPLLRDRLRRLRVPERARFKLCHYGIQGSPPSGTEIHRELLRLGVQHGTSSWSQVLISPSAGHPANTD